MAGKAHLHGHVRWPGKPTSGRYVYREEGGGWYWQCDLHDGLEALPGQYSERDWATVQEAFEDALKHAADCTAINERSAG